MSTQKTTPHPVSPMTTAKLDGPNPRRPEVDHDLELKKLRGETDSQKAIKEYHEGEFQTHDPVTGEAREKGDKVLEDSK